MFAPEDVGIAGSIVNRRCNKSWIVNALRSAAYYFRRPVKQDRESVQLRQPADQTVLPASLFGPFVSMRVKIQTASLEGIFLTIGQTLQLALYGLESLLLGEACRHCLVG
jgi:hypothetical protein